MSINNMSFNNNVSVFEYLIKKLESRQKTLHKTRIAINNIVDMNELRENKVYMLKHFNDIEDEINQAVHSLKALLAQNADISEYADSCIKKTRGFELKIISETKNLNEMKQINQELQKEMEDLKNNRDEKNSMIVFLNEKITYYESKLEAKDKEIFEMKNENERNNETFKRLTEEIEILKIELDAQNFNKYQNLNQQAFPKQEQENDFENLRGILSERENKKKLINEKIKNFNHSNINKSSCKDTNKNNHSSDYKNYQYPLQRKENKNNFDIEDYKKTNDSIGTKMSKHEMISDLIIKITSTPENIDYLNKRFGNDFMNKIFSSNVDEKYLSSLEKALEEKNYTERTGCFSGSFRKNGPEINNKIIDKKNQIKEIIKNNINFNIYSPEEAYEQRDRKNFNKYNNSKENNRFRNNKKNSEIKNNSLNFSVDKLNKNLNISTNNIVPGKNYAKNILCKSLGDKYVGASEMKFEQNLRSYESRNKSNTQRSFTKSSDKKYFNNYLSNESRTFDEYMKNSKITFINNNNKRSKIQTSNRSQEECSLGEHPINEISFSNKIKNQIDDLKPENNIYYGNQNDEGKIIESLQYDYKEGLNINNHEEYNHPYSSRNDENDENDEDKLNKDINDIINQNFDKDKEKRNSPEMNDYISSKNLNKENIQLNLRKYDFESDRPSLEKNNKEEENNFSDQNIN